jgi:hypothetical protein
MKNRFLDKTLVYVTTLTLIAAVFTTVPTTVCAEGYLCPICGEPIEQGINTCPTCGHEFDWDNHILITDYVNRRVIEVDHTGSSIVWSYYSSDDWWPYDSERLANGNTLIGELNYYSPTDRGRVIEIDVSGTILWELSGLNLVTDVERLDNGNTLICEIHSNRVIEVDSAKTIVWKMDSGLWYPTDAERLENGNTLIVDQYHDRVIEVEPDFDIVWETPFIGWLSLQDAERLDSGNTMITSFSPGLRKVYELNPSYVEVWDEDESSYPTDAERLPNGNTLISDGYISNRVFELDSDGDVVWEVNGISLNWPSDVERLRLIINEVTIDIKPGSYPNSINPISYGNVPVAVLTTDDFDASTVNPDTVVFLDAIPCKKEKLEDVDDDGDIDMLFHFKIQELDFELLVDEGDEYPYAYLTGVTIDGQSIEGKDTVKLVPPNQRLLKTIFEHLFERFPNLFPILRLLLHRLGQ